MKDQLSFFNFSLNKVTNQVPDSFEKAKVRIVFTLLLVTVIKILVVLPTMVEYQQHRQLFRAILLLLIFSSLIKLLLYRPGLLSFISHAMLLCGVGVIWSNLIIYAQELNIITIQMILISSLASFYLLGGKPALWYTTAVVLPAVLFIITHGAVNWHHYIQQQPIAQPGQDIVIVLNLFTFVLMLYLYYRAFNQNLKERDVLQQQLQANILEAKALAESRSTFLSTMSHELRTPLNGVIGMANLLKDTATEEQTENLNILEFSAANLLAMINDILDYNKSELDKIELEALPVNLSSLLKKICAGLQMKASEKGLTLKLNADNLPQDKLITTDPMRLTQIVYNLTGNAIKFTESGSVEVSTEVLLNDDDKMRIRFAVSDTGIGISKERQQVIFDPFTQASSDTTRVYGGTGLGLAIVKRLVRLFKSEIELDSQPGKGSVFAFEVEFPVFGGDFSTFSEFRAEKVSFKGLKLLIVEDNRVNVLILKKLLSKWDIETGVAENGQEAVEIMTKESFDGVLMDIHMPVMDGYTSAMSIRSLRDPVKAATPIIAITASVSANIQANIKQAGMQDYLPKPFQADDLYEKIHLIYKQRHSVAPGANKQ